MNRHLEMPSHKTRGTLITFCGLDGCGKTSMIKLLQEHFSKGNRDVILTKQPTNAIRQSEIFRTFMDVPDNSAYEYRALSLLAAADRISHCKSVILPALQAGKVVICDRYFFSCLANLMARGYVGDKWIYEIARDIPKPDFSFFLDVPVEKAISRVREREDEKNRYIDISLQYRLRNEYLNICGDNGGILIDSSDSESNTFSKILSNLR